jgi:protein gp37
MQHRSDDRSLDHPNKWQHPAEIVTGQLSLMHNDESAKHIPLAIGKNIYRYYR